MKTEKLENSIFDALIELQEECPYLDFEKDNPFTEDGAFNILAAIGKEEFGLSEEDFIDLFYGD